MLMQGETSDRLESNLFSTLDKQASKAKIFVGAEAFSLFLDPIFITEWENLYDHCPWATPFQNRKFVIIWYHLFKDNHTPIVIIQNKANQLIGLITLTISADGNISGAGTDTAEYQVWLSYPENSDNFIKQSLLELSETYPGKAIKLKYIPHGTPLSWFENDPSFKARCILKVHKQSLMKLDSSKLTKELQKKNRKEKINRLKRLGELQLCKITDADLFDRILDYLILQSDFRKGAMFGSCPFQEFPNKKKLMSLLFRQKLVHVTLLKLNDKIIASNVGVLGKRWVHLQGINTHCPMHARYSPGILHFLMLGVLLAEEGIEVFDLTPGGDSYKNILATDFIQAYELTYMGPIKCLTHKVGIKINLFFRKQSERVGISFLKLRRLRQQLLIGKQKMKLIKHVRFNDLLTTRNKHSLFSRKPALHKIDLQVQLGATKITLKLNALDDLIIYSPKGTLRTKWEFLQGAMKRLESGQVCYTWTDKMKLLACIWVAPPLKSNLIKPYSISILEEAYIIEETYINSSIGSEFNNILSLVLTDIRRYSPDSTLYILI